MSFGRRFEAQKIPFVHLNSKPQKNSLLSNSPIYHLGRIFFQKLLKFSVFLMSDNDACLGILSDRTQLHVGVFTS